MEQVCSLNGDAGPYHPLLPSKDLGRPGPQTYKGCCEEQQTCLGGSTCPLLYTWDSGLPLA